jgi:hypothetical protein
MPVIPTSQEVGNGRMAIRGQCREELVIPHVNQQFGYGVVSLSSQLCRRYGQVELSPSPVRKNYEYLSEK